MRRSIKSSYWLWLPNKDTNCTVSNTQHSAAAKKIDIHNHAEPETDFFFCDIQTERENKEKCNSWLQIISQSKGREAVAQLDSRGFIGYRCVTSDEHERNGTTFMRANEMWRRELALLLNTVTGLEADERRVLFWRGRTSALSVSSVKSLQLSSFHCYYILSFLCWSWFMQSVTEANEGAEAK